MTKAYHFLNADMTASSGDEKPWEVGETRTIPDVSLIKLCEYGYHASPTLWNALQYAVGPVACLVEVGESYGSDNSPAPKSVHATRTLIKAVNIERELRLFAADCAERVLYIFEKAHRDDKCPRKAIQAARDCANGNATMKDLAAARAAAWDASQAATQAAARAAGWAATQAAARDAAQAATRAAAWAATRDAETIWQRAHFNEICGQLLK